MNGGWIDRQMPVGDEIFLDHVGYFAAGLDRAGETLARLVFQVSSVNTQYNADDEGELTLSGTSNRLVKLRRGFLEVLAATSDTPLADRLRAGLGRYAGLHVVALTHPDMAAQRRRLVADGFAMQEPVNLRRRVPTAEGERVMAYTVLRTGPDVMPEGRVQMLTTHTPELFWTPGATEHANLADGLTDLLVCVSDPVEAAARFARFAARPTRRRRDWIELALDRGRMLFADAAAVVRLIDGFKPPGMPYIVGQALRTRSVTAVDRTLRGSGIAPVHADRGLICIHPSDALGGYLLFHEASVADPWSELARRR